MKEEITLKEIHSLLTAMDNKLTAMNSYYAGAVSKALISKDELQKIKDTVSFKEVEVNVRKKSKRNKKKSK